MDFQIHSFFFLYLLFLHQISNPKITPYYLDFNEELPCNSHIEFYLINVILLKILPELIDKISKYVRIPFILFLLIANLYHMNGTKSRK